MKYSADPNPVRSAEGTVPRHKEVMGWGDARMVRRTGRSAEERDCWTRVFRRSAGWRSTAEETPEARPARKWKVGWEEDLEEGWRLGGEIVVVVVVVGVGVDGPITGIGHFRARRGHSHTHGSEVEE